MLKPVLIGDFLEFLAQGQFFQQDSCTQLKAR